MGADTSSVKKQNDRNPMHMTTKPSEYRLGRRPGQQGPRPQSINQGWIEKSATGNDDKVREEREKDKQKIEVASQEFTIGTWNVRSLWSTGKLELLRKEMERYRFDIVGLSEMRWTGAGEMNGKEVIWSGEEKDHSKGVGFLLNSTARKALMGYRPVNSRIIAARFNGKPINFSIIQTYAPTADSSEEEMDDFYDKLENTLKDLPRKDVKVIMGDWNAKIGKDNTGWEQAMQKYGYGERNERGEKLLDFATKHNFIICNTMFKQKDCRKWTWRSPDGKYTNMIDLILIDKRWKSAVKLCRTFQGADIASDHSLVLCNIKLRLRRIPKKKYQSNRKRSIEALDNQERRREFEKEISNKIRNLHTEESSIDKKVEDINNIIIQTAEKVLPLTEIIHKKWISEKTLELAKRKREVKLRMKESEEMTTKYKKLCNEVKASARKDKQEWLNIQCSNIDKCVEEQKSREAYKLIKSINKKWQPRQTAIKDKNGNILMDRKQYIHRWTEYCSELYKDNEQVNENILHDLKRISPPTKDDIKDNILYEEVEEALKSLKKRKSPGCDNIPGEMLQAGGEDLTKEIHKLCTQIWTEGKMPEEWTKSILITIPKKGDLSECKNYRTIALMSHMGKILMKILTNRLNKQLEEYMSDEQAGFRKDRSTVQQILALRLMAEKTKRKNSFIYNCFIDFQKAFDSVRPSIIWATLRSYGVGKRLIELLQNASEQSKTAVKVDNELGEWFRIYIGTKQGDPSSPSIFIGYLERMMDIIQSNGSGISIQGEMINNLKFADDIDLIEGSCEALQKSVYLLDKTGKEFSMKINIGKTKSLVFGKKDIEKEVVIGDEIIENVKEFVYLGSLMTWDNDCTKDIKRRIDKAKGVMAGFNNIWKSKTIRYAVKLKILETCIFSTVLYACETWTLKKTDTDRILAFEMNCYRRILHLSWTEKVTNIEVRKKLNINVSLMQKLIKRKLGLFGHICRMNADRKIKSIMLGIMEGRNRRGRPCREWLDDIQDWCKKDVHSLTHLAQDRTTWRNRIKCAVDTYGLSAHG